MNRISLLLPFCLPPPELAGDLLRELHAPALASLLAHAAGGTFAAEPLAEHGWNYSLPHENWLARQCGLAFDPRLNSAPTAATAMRGLGLKADDGYWFVLSPAHIQIARNRLLLADPRTLLLDEAESRALFDAASPYFEELGKTVLYGDALNWFVRADDWHALQTASADATLGRNMDAMMPQGPTQLAWRKLQNEIQMLWFTDAVNARRELAGKPLINALWLSGGAPAGGTDAVQPQFDALFEADRQQVAWACLGALGRTRPEHRGTGYIEAIEGGSQRHGLLLIDALSSPANSADWSGWLTQMHHLENTCFAPLLSLMRSGRLQALTLVATRREGLAEFKLTRNSLRKFWVRPSLKRLLP